MKKTIYILETEFKQFKRYISLTEFDYKKIARHKYDYISYKIKIICPYNYNEERLKNIIKKFDKYIEIKKEDDEMVKQIKIKLGKITHKL